MKPETENMINELVSGVGDGINHLISIIVVLAASLFCTVVALMIVVFT